MVQCWLPDPPQENTMNGISPGIDDNTMTAHVDELTTDEEDNAQYAGYQPLPLDPTDEIDPESSEEESSEESKPSTSSTLPPIVPIEQTLVKEVWSSPTPHDIEMDAEKENEVKMAMMNFTLPSSSIPEWARNVPEDQWKQMLIDKIQSKSDKQ